MRLALVVFNILDNFFNSPLWFFQSAMYVRTFKDSQ